MPDDQRSPAPEPGAEPPDGFRDVGEDTAAANVRSLHDRGMPQDVVAVYLAGRYYSVIELEQLGDRDLDLADLRDRLESVVWVSDEEFAAHGLTPEEIADLRRWALEWESDLGLRILEDYDDSQDTEG